MSDLTAAERWSLAPVIALMFALGLYPQMVLAVTNSTVMQIVQQIKLAF